MSYTKGLKRIFSNILRGLSIDEKYDVIKNVFIENLNSSKNRINI